jgi:hypothetical protein
MFEVRLEFVTSPEGEHHIDRAGLVDVLQSYAHSEEIPKDCREQCAWLMRELTRMPLPDDTDGVSHSITSVRIAEGAEGGEPIDVSMYFDPDKGLFLEVTGLQELVEKTGEWLGRDQGGVNVLKFPTMLLSEVVQRCCKG